MAIVDPQVRSLAEQAHRLAQQGQRDASRQAWRRVLELAPGHTLAQTYLGQDAYTRGDLAEARSLLEAAVASQPQFALALANLGRVLQALGDIAGALSCFDRALKQEPQAFAVHFEKAAIYERLDQVRMAALSYEHGLKSLPSGVRLNGELEALAGRARKLVAANRADLIGHLETCLRDLRPLQGGHRLQRFDESLRIATGQWPQYQPRPQMFPIAGLPSQAFYEREDLPWTGAVESATADVRRELEQVLADDADGFIPYVRTGEGEPAGQFAPLDHNLDWGAYFLWQHGKPIAEHIERCPATAAALQHAPQIDIRGRAPAAFFSALKPRTHIPAHNGATNCRLTVHLPLLVPESCALRVGNHVRRWTPGELLLFDDTVEHEAWNRSDQLRVVLIFDVWHPALSELERLLIRRAIESLVEYYGDAAPLGEL